MSTVVSWISYAGEEVLSKQKHKWLTLLKTLFTATARSIRHSFCSRSILTIPWIELGGSVTITCAKTGYSANVEFLTKPFYGGKKNRITAEVFQPNDKKPFLSVTGEWNGGMEAKWADGVSIFQIQYHIRFFKYSRQFPSIPAASKLIFVSIQIWKQSV